MFERNSNANKVDDSLPENIVPHLNVVLQAIKQSARMWSINAYCVINLIWSVKANMTYIVEAYTDLR